MLNEVLYVRADRVCVGDLVEMPSVLGDGTRLEYVTSVRLVGDDVVLGNYNAEERLTTSKGNVLQVQREVLPTDPKRYQP